MRLGGTRPIKINVRLIAATHADLKDAVARGAFSRRSLLPSQRCAALHPAASRAQRRHRAGRAGSLQLFNRELRKRFTGFTPAAAELLPQYSWPGNIRELKNVIERTMILADEGDIDAIALPEEIREHARNYETASKNIGDYNSDLDISPTGRQLVTLRELEDDYIQDILVATGNNKTQAARILAIHPTSLLRRLKKDSAAE